MKARQEQLESDVQRTWEQALLLRPRLRLPVKPLDDGLWDAQHAVAPLPRLLSDPFGDSGLVLHDLTDELH